MATFNSAKTLKLAIASVLAQDFEDYEVWIVGDACRDDSAQVVQSFADRRLHWINLESNSGSQAVPNNEGFRRARGEFIAYLGHDDLWFPWHLSSLLAFISKAQADLVHPLSAAFGPDGLEYMVGAPSTGRTYENHFVYPSCWLYRRGVVDACGSWGNPGELPRGVDMDYLRRIHLAGKKILFYPRLSMLKFPSPWWGTYIPGFQPPQSGFLEKMRRDPLELEQAILLEAAILLAQQTNPRVPMRSAFRQLGRSAAQRAIDLFGTDNRWLGKLRFWHYHRLSRRLRKKRGLPPAPP
ncbi:MAG TPA: glycosyltransferase family 2 protein, partial [Candidatus Binatia bacterium]|nr:glycosyltransferase family 2 protein [Candidatus Binatia bacterium]